MQVADVLERFRFGDEGTLAVQFEDEAFFLQVAKGLPHGDAADTEHRAEVVFRRHLRVGGVGAIEDPGTEVGFYLLVERGF